jgi:hypothetical protein
MEENLEGGRGPPRAVAPLEREREREREREISVELSIFNFRSEQSVLYFRYDYRTAVNK